MCTGISWMTDPEPLRRLAEFNYPRSGSESLNGVYILEFSMPDSATGFVKGDSVRVEAGAGRKQ
jgi:hypothetical protein